MQEGDAVDWKSWMTEGWMMRKRKKAKVSVFGHSRNCSRFLYHSLRSWFLDYERFFSRAFPFVFYHVDHHSVLHFQHPRFGQHPIRDRPLRAVGDYSPSRRCA